MPASIEKRFTLMGSFFVQIWNKEPSAAFRPTIEDRRVKNAFLTDVPNKLKYHSPNLPMMIGITSAEGAMRTQSKYGA